MRLLGVLPVICAIALMAASCTPLNPLGGTTTTVGIVKSDNGGNDWQFKNALEGQNAGNLNNSRISRIVFGPNGNDTIYAGTYDDGLFVSTNAGNTWKRILSLINVYDIVVNPTNPSEIYVGGFYAEHGKALITEDAGKSWIEIYNEESTGNAVRSLALSPTVAGEIIIGMSSGALNKSVDGGKTWKAMVGFQDKINQITWNKDGLYVLSRTKGLYKSTDDGQNFQSLTAPLSPTGSTFSSLINPPSINNYYHFALSEQQSGLVYLTTDAGLYKTTDAGLTWKDLKLPISGNDNNVASRAVVVNKLNDNVLYASAGATVYHSVNGGDTWQTQAIKTLGFVNTLAIDPVIEQAVYGGLYVDSSR